MKKISITIGIPAYNEENNIGFLLNSIFNQKRNYYNIDKIIVVSDGSTDRTLEILKEYKDIKVLTNKKRIGQQKSQNKILDICSSDAVVFLEADTVIQNTNTLDNLIKTYKLNMTKRIGLLAGLPIVAKPDGFFETILYHGYQLKRSIFSQIRDGDSVYSSGGHAIRLIPSEITKWFRWKENVPEDSYLYLCIKAKGYKLLLVKNAITLKRNVTNIKDRYRQCSKFQGGVVALNNIFGKKFVQQEYSIKFDLLFKNTLKYFIKEPFWTFAYFCEAMINRVYTRVFFREFSDLSNPYNSSKTLKEDITISNYDEPKNPYYGGGGALSNQKIAEYLSDRYNVQILCGKYPNSRDYEVNSIKYKHIGISFGGSLLGQIVFSLILPFYAIMNKSDLWLETFIPPCSVGFIPLFFGHKVIGVTSLLNAEFFSKKYRLPFHWVERFGLRFYKYIIALNEETKKYILKYNSSINVAVIPRGISEEYFKLKRGNKHNVIFLGRLDVYQKGLDLLIKSWRKVVIKNTKAKLLIYGKGTEEDENQLKNLINKQHLSRKIFMKGWVEGKQKMKAIESSEIVVCPSRFEGFNNTALEALASGKCVISYDIDGLKWIDGKVKIKVKPYDYRLFSKRLVDLMNNDRERTKLSAEARRFAKKYSWKNIFNKYDLYFKRVINNSDSKF